MLNLPKQIPMQSLLHKTKTTCFTRTATIFSVSQIKKNLSKTTTKTLPSEKMGNKHYKKMKFFIKDSSGKCDQIRRKLQIWSHLLEKSLMESFTFCALKHKKQGIKNERLFDYIYSYIYFIMQSLRNVYKSWTVYKIIWNYVILYKIICFFFFPGNRGVLRAQLNIYGFFFWKKVSS